MTNDRYGDTVPILFSTRPKYLWKSDRKRPLEWPYRDRTTLLKASIYRVRSRSPYPLKSESFLLTESSKHSCKVIEHDTFSLGVGRELPKS